MKRGSLSSPESARAVRVLPEPGGPRRRSLERGGRPWVSSLDCCRCSRRTRLSLRCELVGENHVGEAGVG